MGRLKNSFAKKISSDQKQVSLQLIPTEKIIQRIKRLNPKAFLVGFKLEIDADLKQLKQKAAALIRKSNCDLVVANSSQDQHYQGYIFDRHNNILIEGKTRREISKGLGNILCQQK